MKPDSPVTRIAPLVIMLAAGFHINAQVLCISCTRQNSATPTGTNLILNGGFENGCTTSQPYFCPRSSAHNCTLTSWICENGGSMTYASIYNNQSNTMLVEGKYGAYLGNFFSDGCSVQDDTSCVSAMPCVTVNMPSGTPRNPDTAYGGVNGISIKQVVSGLTIGRKYVFEFWAGGEAGFPNHGLFAVNIGFGNIFLRDPQTIAGSGTLGLRYKIVFSAIASTHQFKFTNWGHLCTTCSELALDDVRLYALGTSTSCITSLDPENPVSSFNIYHDAGTQMLHINTQSAEPFELSIYNANGQCVIRREFESSADLPTETLATGIYYYRTRSNASVIATGKVLIE